MSNQSFGQFAGQPGFPPGAPAGAPAPGPAMPGFPPGTPGYPPAQQPQAAPTPQVPAPYAQQYAPQAAPPGFAWPNQGQPQAPTPQVPAPYAQQQYVPATGPGIPQVQAAGPGWTQPGGPVPGFQAPQAQPPATFGVPQATFGAGAFGAAKIMGDKLPCAPGLYRMRVVDSGQRRDPKKGLPFWRLKSAVVQVFSGTQPVNSEVTHREGLTGEQDLQYAGSFFLQLAIAALGFANEAELKNHLNQQYGTFQVIGPDGAPRLLDGWGQFADALQNATQQVNNCPPNPLAGREFIVEIVPNQGKDGKMYERWQSLRRVTG